MPDKIVEPPLHTAPAVFTRALLDWRPWLEPLAEESLTERQMTGLVDAVRAKSPYFRLLARDPDALRARTLTDKDIFYNPEAGLPRGERELAAAATSRFNGCIYCASVHARHSATYSKSADDVQRVARKYLNPEMLQIVAVGDAGKIKPVLEKYGAVTVYDSNGGLVADEK